MKTEDPSHRFLQGCFTPRAIIQADKTEGSIDFNGLQEIANATPT